MKKSLSVVIAFFIIISCYSQSVSDLRSSGFAKIQKQDFKGALADLSKVVSASPKDAEAFAAIGLANLMLDDYNGALKNLDKAIELQPIPDYYYLRGLTRSRLKDDKGALADLNTFIGNGSENSDAYILRATAKQNLADLRGAIDDYTKVIEIDPKNSEAFLLRGLAKIMVNPNDYNKAWCSDFEAAIRLGHPSALDQKISSGCK